jgi:Flp pilus assembly secretin CpaC
MTRMTLILAMIVAVALATTDCAFAADLRIVSNDENATFVPLTLSKSVVIDTQEDIHNVIVSDPNVVNAVVQTSRRFFLYARTVGQANVFLYDAKGHQIAAADVWVTDVAVSNARKESVVYYGGGFGWRTYSCTPALCVGAKEAPPPPSQSPVTINMITPK